MTDLERNGYDVRPMLVQGLAHLVVTAVDPSAWSTYAREIVGFAEATDHGDAAVRYRIDDRAWRLAVHPGERNGLGVVGWEVRGEPEMEAAVAAVEGAGITVKVDSALARERAARVVASFDAPGGHATELVCGPSYEGGFVSPLGVRFRTGELGMGHVVLTVPDDDFGPALSFYREVLGFRVSEHLDFDPLPVEGALLHCGPRHHSLGLVRGGRHPGCDHFMVEVVEPDDVGRCWDRMLAAGVEIRRMIGRHSDDHMFSFYAATPSRIGIEIGSGGRLIDPATWSAETLRSPAAGDFWGHQPPTVLEALLSRAREERGGD